MGLRGIFQNAYVTRDLDGAMQLLSDRYGITGFAIFDVNMVLSTPQGAKPSQCRVALSWVGSVQLEIIEPISGQVDHYVSFLPDASAGAALRFHHYGLRRNSLARMKGDALALGLPIAFEGEVAGISCIYVDARAQLGHYLEYVYATPEGWALSGWPEHLVPED